MVGERVGKFSLDLVKKLIIQYRSGDNTALWFSARSRSLDCVINVFLCSEVEAESRILDGILQLKKSDFHRSNIQWDLIVDEYGLENYLGYNWYVKFTVDNQNGLETLEQISFHLLEKKMRLADGRELTVF